MGRTPGSEDHRDAESAPVSRSLRVTLFSRRKGSAWSVERIFADLATHLPQGVEARFCHNRFQSRGFFKRAYDIVRAVGHQGDVNHVTGDVHYLVFALRARRTILTVLDCVFMHEASRVKRGILWLLWLWLPLKRCALVTTISEATRQELLRWVHYDPAKVRVIHCSVSPVFKRDPRPFNEARPRILHIGTTPNKNLERHLLACRDLPCEFVVIGEPSVDQRHAMARSGLPCMVLSGLSDEEMAEQYRLCDLVLFASTYEGFGLPIVEAQAVGRPVVCGNVASMPEVAGNAACLVDPYDVAAIRAGVLRILRDEEYRNALVNHGFANVGRFEAGAIAAKYAALYREIAAKAVTT